MADAYVSVSLWLTSHFIQVIGVSSRVVNSCFELDSGIYP